MMNASLFFLEKGIISENTVNYLLIFYRNEQ